MLLTTKKSALIKKNKPKRIHILKAYSSSLILEDANRLNTFMKPQISKK